MHYWVPKSTRRIEPVHDPSTKKTRSSRMKQQKRNKATKQSSNTRPIKKNTLPPQETTRWVRKTLLQAQGYYQGSTHLWLPKKRSTAPPHIERTSMQFTTLESVQGTPQFTNGNAYQWWRPIIKKQNKKLLMKLSNHSRAGQPQSQPTNQGHQ